MSNEDSGENTDEPVSLLSRRELLGTSAVLGAGAIASAGPGVGSASAQTSGTEPRIALGDDWEIDPYDDGSGNTNLRLRHIPSGAELVYDVASDEWVLGTLNADMVSAGQIAIGNNNFVSDGDYVGLISLNPQSQTEFSSTSTTYEFSNDQLNHRVDSTLIIPSNAQMAGYFAAYVNVGSGETVDIALYDSTNEVPVVEVNDISSNGWHTKVDSYTPSSEIFTIQAAIRTNPGDNTSSISAPFGSFGVQL